MTIISPKGEIVFSVSDTGDGIPERDLPHIFERNFSGGNRIKKSSEKTGLGLYISKQIITQHSGSMFARNNADGGAEISFYDPLLQLIYGQSTLGINFFPASASKNQTSRSRICSPSDISNKPELSTLVCFCFAVSFI